MEKYMEKKEESQKKQPEMRLKAGPLSLAIWENDSGKGPYYTVSLKREYKDNDEWKSTQSLRINDIPKAAILLQKAYEHLILKTNI